MFHQVVYVGLVIVCCLLQHAVPQSRFRNPYIEVFSVPRSEYKHHRNAGRYVYGDRGLFSGIGSIVKAVGGAAKKATLESLRVGHKMAMLPLNGVEWVAKKGTHVIGWEKDLLKSMAKTVSSAWKKAKAVEFPGKSIVAFFFPNHMISIVDKLTKGVFYIASKTHKSVEATLAYTLYSTLKVAFSGVNTAINALGYHCVTLNDTKMELNAGLVNTLTVVGAKACGLDTLKPLQNITITHNDGEFIVVTMPWVLRNLQVRIKDLQVQGFMLDVKNQPVETSVKEIACTGRVSLQKGTFLRLATIHIEVKEITGLEIKLVGNMEGGILDGVIKTVSQSLGDVLKDKINEQLVAMEKQIADFLLGRKS